MTLIDYSHSYIAIIPPLLAILLAIVTHRVLISLGVAIVAGSFMLNHFNPLATGEYLLMTFTGLFWDKGLNLWNISLISFLLLLGMLTAFITRMGGTTAFAKWALVHIKSARQARVFTVFLGMLIFIDDYFNSLAVGQVARPVTDQYKISRAKLAYLVDSTAAPVCLISPFSSWGAFIMGVLAIIISTHPTMDYTPLSAFIAMLQYNFYPFLSVLIVLTVAYTGWGIGPMKGHQLKAALGELFSHDKGPVPGEITKIPQDENGHVRDLVIPILTLIIATVVFIIILGVLGTHTAGLPITVMRILENTDVAIALVLGAGMGLLSCVGFAVVDQFKTSDYVLVVRTGVKAMAPAIYILLFAWLMIEIINAMGTGVYLASLLNETLPLALLPTLLFLLAAAMGFSTGSSWGTFGVMLPIAANVALSLDPSLQMPMMAAVLSGAIFGDHCSPLSDTSILSSTGAGCHLMDHVITQIPYCLIKATICLAGFLTFGFTRSYPITLLILLAGYILAIVLIHKHAD
jgi:tetracycline resistance efflux pump